MRAQHVADYTKVTQKLSRVRYVVYIFLKVELMLVDGVLGEDSLEVC